MEWSRVSKAADRSKAGDLLHGDGIRKMIMQGKQCSLGRVEFGIGRLKGVEQRIELSKELKGQEGAF